MALGYRACCSSGVGGNGSPRREESRTSVLNLTLLASATLGARGASWLAYHFEGAAPPGCFEPPTASARLTKQYRNPIGVAQERQRMLDADECASRADLAYQHGATWTTMT